jgi:hypothetical protein
MPGRDEALSLKTAIDRRTDSEHASILARVRRAKLRLRTAFAFAPSSPPTPSLRAFSARPILRAAAAAYGLLGALDFRLTPSWSRSCSTSSFFDRGSLQPLSPQPVLSAFSSTLQTSAVSYSTRSSTKLNSTRAGLRPNALATQLRSSLLLHTLVSSCAVPYVSASEDAFAELEIPCTRTRSHDPSRHAPDAATRTVAKVSTARAPAAARHVQRCGRKFWFHALARLHPPRCAQGRGAAASRFARRTTLTRRRPRLTGCRRASYSACARRRRSRTQSARRRAVPPAMALHSCSGAGGQCGLASVNRRRYPARGSGVRRA